MIDQHVHSMYSIDSNVTIDEYLVKMKENQCDYLTITDHFDLRKNLKNDSITDYINNFDKLFEDVNNRANNKIKVGIEVGHNSNAIQETSQLLSRYNFSVILLSVHDNDALNLSYYMANSSEFGVEKCIRLYIDQLLEAVNSGIDFDVLTHVGYIFRYVDKNIDCLDYVDLYDDVLKALVKKSKALELNTGCIRYGTKNIVEFYVQILKKFHDFGGKYVSVGSDAHDISAYCFGFDKAYAILRKAGFSSCTHIVDRKFNLTNLPKTFFDQHVHTCFSPDSSVSLQSYIDIANFYNVSHLTFTDHLDLLVNINKHQGFDYKKSFENLILQVQKINNSRVKVGIEVGYNSTTVNGSKQVLNSYNFSLVLLSVHENDEHGIRYSQTKYLDIPFSQVIKLYVQQIYEAINSGIDFDVLSHIGFIFRYADSCVNPLEYVSMFDEILKSVSKQSKALEYNTSCMHYGVNNINDFYKIILEKFLMYGGKYISIGSDAHNLDQYLRDFTIAKRFIKSCGFNHIVKIVDRKFELVLIE